MTTDVDRDRDADDELTVDDLEGIEQCGTTPTGPVVHATTPDGTVMILFGSEARIALEAAEQRGGGE